MRSILNRLFNRLFGSLVRQMAKEEAYKESRLQMEEILSSKGYDVRLLQVEENLRSNNTFIDAQRKAASCNDIDYFDFENYFRGSRETIKEWQNVYVPYFKGRKNVLDIGCGRGEFLELLTEAGVDVTGVDVYSKFVEYCKSLNLNIVEADGITYLRNQEKVGGIFASQLIEHLGTGNMIEFCRLAYQKLEEDCYLVMETPNPMCLAVFTHAFYIDPSHNKPIHPLTVQYILERAGFREVKIIYPEVSRLSEGVPMLQGKNIDNLEEFNKALSELNDVLYGSQDYAVIARK